ncbi:MAG TPA: PIN domain-containing protein [Blastocatellia bacterium]|nr:PIN domain-containing protein [Blastocatellia bacterium]
MSQPSSPGAVVIDANILISICSRELSESVAKAALAGYAAQRWVFYAPSAIITEVLFILCQKLQTGIIDAAKHRKAVEDFSDYMSVIQPPPRGDAALLLRAEEVRTGYSCLHSADGFYIALTEELARLREAEFLTFDKRVINVVTKNAPSVKVRLLPS